MATKSKQGKPDKLLLQIDASFDINDTNLAAKIKRLKIEESHLLKTLNSTFYTHVLCDGNTNDNQISDYNKLISQLKELYENINILFGDIKGSTSSQEAIRSLDISEMEENISELEEKIKYLKNYIQLQLLSLKVDEEQLTEALNQNPSEICIKSKHKTQGQKYKKIVPSPVRVLINSSLKSPEVQEFQDFISSSVNRFGGWNEYHHNIFATCWRKYFQPDCSTSFESFFLIMEKSNCFQSFLQELHRKLACFKTDEIIAHCKWYSKYMYLKERKQLAINKWKTNKRLIKKCTLKDELRNEDTSRKSVLEKLTVQDRNWRRSNIASLDQGVIDEEKKDQMNNNIKMKKRKPMDCANDNNLPRLQYNKPTKQWLNRTLKIEDSLHFNSNNVENLRKLQIPNWRIGL